MDEYDYLEAQLEAGAKLKSEPPADALPPPPAQETNGTARHSSRERSRDRSRGGEDREKDRHRDKDRDRERKRSRSRDKDRSERSDRGDRGDRRDRPRDDHRDRPRDRDYDRGYDRRGGDHRGGGDRGGYRDHRRDDRGYGGGGRDRGYVRAPDRESTPPEVRAQRKKEEEQRELERTVRTIMVMNLNLKADEKDIFDFFSVVGAINDIKLIVDKNTKRSKGICYVEYQNIQSAMNAVTVLNAKIMMNMPVLVKPSEAEKNLAWEAQEEAKKQQAASINLMPKLLNPIKLQILNLHPDIGQDELKELFATFGDVTYVNIVRDPVGVSTGEGFVQYADKPMADEAIKHFNGREIAGKVLSVAVAPLSTILPPIPIPGLPMAVPGMPGVPGMPAIPGAMPGMPGAALPPPPPIPGGLPGALPGPPGMPAAAQGANPANVTDVLANMAGVGEVDDLDEADHKFYKLNAQSRAALMSRLATSAGLQAPPSFLGNSAPSSAPAASAGPTINVSQQVMMDQGLLGPASPIPTPCILMKNMFTDADKADAHWQEDLVDDVKGEAAKFGEVVHCHVEPNSKGHVYLKFAQSPSAEAAYRAFHGRYYSGNQIVVSYQFLAPYNSYFGLK